MDGNDVLNGVFGFLFCDADGCVCSWNGFVGNRDGRVGLIVFSDPGVLCDFLGGGGGVGNVSGVEGVVRFRRTILGGFSLP